jgi:cytochrome c553
MVCGIQEGIFTELQTHEIARGSFRSKALKSPSAWIRTCSLCHERHLDGMPIARQLAIKKKHDPEYYDRIAVNRLRNRADEAITENEVDQWTSEIW